MAPRIIPVVIFLLPREWLEVGLRLERRPDLFRLQSGGEESTEARYDSVQFLGLGAHGFKDRVSPLRDAHVYVEG